MQSASFIASSKEEYQSWPSLWEIDTLASERPAKHSGDMSHVSSERCGSGGISRMRVAMATRCV